MLLDSGPGIWHVLCIEQIRIPGLQYILLTHFYVDHAGDLGAILAARYMLKKETTGILKLIGEGYKNKDIAEYLGISIKTVEKHRANLMQKLDLHNVSDLTAYAIEKGIASR